MTETTGTPPAETLDPTSWEEARRLGHAMVDDMIDYLSSVEERPAWRTVPAETRRALAEDAPYEGVALADVYDAFKQHVLPYPTGNLHPGFFGWVMGNGTVTGMFADMLAAGMNAHGAGYDQSARLVEDQVIRWFAEWLGFPADASGLLVSGGTMANMNALAVARFAKAGFDTRELGVQAADTPMLTVYGGAETHSWILRGCEFMGLGRQAFRKIPVDANYKIKIDACRTQIIEDIQNGMKPFCIVASAGTVNTGAIDDIAALRNLADEFGLWLHIDGAFGSLAALSEKARPLVQAQASADSIAFDLHKWGYMPYDVGCVLVRDPKTQSNTFAQSPSYLVPMRRGVAVNNTHFADRGIQLSRSFRALKVWMSMKEHGANKLGRIIQQNIDQGRYLADLVEASEDLELMAPQSLNIVCFRYSPANVAEDRLDAINEEILLRIQESGSAVPSNTRIGGKFAIRACITNFRTRQEHLDRLVADVRRIGAQLE